MKFIKKLIRRIFFLILILAALAVFLNAKTRLIRNIDTYLPIINEERAELIREISDKVNEFVYEIPTPEEFWAKIHHTELPIDPNDIAANTYYSSDSMLNFCISDNISAVISGNEADIYGVTNDPSSKHIVYRFLDHDGTVLDQFTDICDNEGKFRKIVTIPDGSAQLAVFTGPEQYGSYQSTVYNYLPLERDANGDWSISVSPVYEHNITEYGKARSLSHALKNTYDICSTDKGVISLANTVTEGISGNYEKILAIHDWICANIYYDTDSVSSNGLNDAAYVATDVIGGRKAVCLGYSNLFAAMCRALSIPCNVITGYAIGPDGYDTAWNAENINTTEPNHAWNEVYLDDRRIIVDTTWDSQNRIENGVAETGRSVSHLYFDANIRFFSQNHKIIGYGK